MPQPQLCCHGAGFSHRPSFHAAALNSTNFIVFLSHAYTHSSLARINWAPTLCSGWPSSSGAWSSALVIKGMGTASLVWFWLATALNGQLYSIDIISKHCRHPHGMFPMVRVAAVRKLCMLAFFRSSRIWKTVFAFCFPSSVTLQGVVNIHQHRYAMHSWVALFQSGKGRSCPPFNRWGSQCSKTNWAAQDCACASLGVSVYSCNLRTWQQKYFYFIFFIFKITPPAYSCIFLWLFTETFLKKEIISYKLTYFIYDF